MRYLISIIFGLFCFQFLSCKKETLHSGVQLSADPPDSIYYLNIPDTTLTSGSIFVPHGSGCGLIPSPSDAFSDYLFDVNGDLINDLRIHVENAYTFVSASAPCYNYSFYCYVYPLQATDSILADGISQIPTNGIGEVVDSTSGFYSVGTVSVNVPTFAYYVEWMAFD
jgi:hypothetical protein